MTRKAKIIYIVGSVIIGVVSLLAVLLSLIASGAVDTRQTKLVYASVSGEFVYDGQAHGAEEWELVSGELRKGHQSVVTVSGTQKDVGESQNYLSAVIVDEGGADVSGYYEIEYQPGTLRVTPREITVTAQSNTKVYDGTPLVCTDFSVTGGQVAEGHTINASFGASLTQVGTAQNNISVALLDEEGRDVTANYAVTTRSGILEVTPRKLVLQSLSKSREYDGTILTEEEYAVSEGSLADGQNERVTFNASLQNVGSMQNSFAAVIYASDGVTDVTSNYDLECLYGTLEVTPRPLKITTQSGNKVYDGTALTDSGYEITAGSVAEGQEADIRVTGSITKVGKQENAVSVLIYDGGTDVTDNYRIEKETGTLEVTPRPLTIRVYDDTKVYDGTALTNAGYEITAGDVAAEQRIDVQTMGTQTTVGQSANTAAVTITDVAGEEVTSNYDLTLVTGILEITPRKLVLQSSSKSREYDGTILTEEEYAVSEGSLADGQSEKVTFNASLQNVGSMQNSFAAVIYASDGVTDVTSNYDLECLYGTLEVTPRPLKITTQSGNKVYDGTALEDSGYEITAGSVAEGQEADIRVTGSITKVGKQENAVSVLIYDGGTDVTDNYRIEKETGTLEVTPRPLTIRVCDDTKVYDGTALTNAGYEITAGDVAAEQRIDVQTMGTQTTVGQSANTAAVTITDVAGEEVTSNYDITLVTGVLEITPRKLVLQSSSKSREYDGTILTEKEYAVSEGSLADGQSERVTFNASLQNVGSMQNSFAAVIYASDGVTDVTSNYDLECLYGTLEVTPRKLVLQSLSKSREYDGTILTEEGYAVSEGSLADGQSESVTFNASLQNVGSMQNSFAAVIYASDGVTDVTSNYDLECLYGTLEVTPRPLKITTQSGNKVYDGTALTDSGYEITAGSVAEGQEADIRVTGSITKVGKQENAVSVLIYDGGTDVTDNYRIEKETGTLEVTPRPLTIRVCDDTKVYDGTALTNAGYEITAGDVAAEQRIDVQTMGTQTTVGQSANTAAVTITDVAGEEVTSNYDLTLVTGILEITPRKLVLQSLSKSKEYDGTILTEEGYAVSEGSLADGQSERVTFNASLQNVGSMQNSFAAVIYASDGVTDVTSNYDLECLYGTLEVTPRPLKITTQSGNKVYDGTALTDSGYEITAGDVAAEQRIDVQTMGTQTTVGQSANTAAVTITDGAGEEVTSNYDLTLITGILEVTPRKLVLQSLSKSREYDGTILTEEEYAVSEGSLADGQSERVTFNASLQNVGSMQNSFAAVIYASDGVTDVTSNYDLECLYGTLEVTPYRISISTYSSVKIYDGLPLVAQTYTISSERQLIDGHEIASVTMPSSRTDAGTEENLITDIIILNADKEDVTANYEIEYFFGKLNVSPRPITIRSASAAKNYDGTPLTCDDWDYVSITRPLETHDVQVAVSGTRTEVGESDNTIAEVLITQDGQNVTSNYDITCELGVLVVKENASGGAGSGGSAVNMDTSGNIGMGSGSSEEEFLALRVYSDQSGKIYLRLTSFGDLNNAETKWEAAVPYKGLLDGKYSYNYLSGIALENAGYEPSDVFIEVLGTDYYLPYYMTRDEGGYLIQQSDVLYEGSTEQIYNLTYFLYDLIGEGAVIGSLGEYSDAELAYRDWVYKQYTNYSLSSRLKEYFDGIIAEKGWDKEQDIAVLIGEVASFIQGAATYNLKYNRGLDSSADIVYDFLQVYREGICQHYATAATVLLRYLGFPARYTVGYVGDTKSGEWVEITAANAHAWVEVYVSGFGWVQVEVTGGGPGGGSGGGSGSGSGGSGGGSGGLLPSQKLNVKPVDEYMLFDGVSVLTHSGKLQGLYDLEQQGYTYRATVSGSRKALGISTSKVEKFVLYDPDGNDVTDKFEIVFSEGILQVYIGIIRIKTEGGQKIYDGTALTNGQYSVESELLDGHFMQTEITGSQTDIGSNINTFSLQVLDGAGNDVTYMYRIIADYGILEVEAREITVIAKDAQKQADGTPLTCNEFVPLPDGALALGHQIQVEITGSQTNVGYSDNVVRSVVIYDSEGKDVTSNYIIKTQNGKLTVTI